MTPTRIIFAAAIAVSTFAMTTEASATSFAVKIACASDYYAHCSKHAPGSSGVRQCMRTNGAKLSGRCINALVASGQVSRSYVQKRKASH